MPRPTMLALVIALSFNAISSVPAFSAEAENFDLQGFIDQSIVTGVKQITIPPGRYRVTPRNGRHLNLHDLGNVQIIADGVEMICTETTRALTIANCRNVTVRGLVIDFDPLPFTQGKIVELSNDKKTHVVELFDGYPGAESARAFKYEIFRPDTRTLRCEDRNPERLEVIDRKRLRIINVCGSGDVTEQVGDLVVIGSQYAPHGVIPHAVVCEGNVNVRLEEITLYASNSFGFFECNCDGTVYLRCRIDRRPAAADIAQRADPRLRSLNADAFHSKHATKGPAYIECAARYMGDDAININGDYHMVTECRGAELRVLAKGLMNIAVGDVVEVFSYDGSRLPNANAVKIERDGTINDEEKAFVLKQRLHEPLRTGWKADAWKVTLDRAVELPRGSLIASASRMGNGFLVQGCDFGYNRSRGIIIKASDGKVIDNKLTENWMPAILVSPECWWLESGCSNNVEIRGNTVVGCRQQAISVRAQSGGGLITGAPAYAGAHSNIAIVDNTIIDCPSPNIEVTSTKGLAIKNNVFHPVGGLKPEQGPTRWEPVSTVNCSEITQENNSVN